jgi:hypothetical protein
MTEEEYFRKNYPDSCYGDKPLSPHWDFFQDGVEFGEQQSENKIADLEAQIEKTKSLNKEIIKALIECLDYEWLPAHNGKAKYLYLQTVIDIVNEKFEEIKEK